MKNVGMGNENECKRKMKKTATNMKSIGKWKMKRVEYQSDSKNRTKCKKRGNTENGKYMKIHEFTIRKRSIGVKENK